MTNDPDFLSLEDVLLLHEQQLALYGGAHGLRNPDALDSAVAMPRATFDGQFVHDDLSQWPPRTRPHRAEPPFVDGNKRTGLAAALVFLDLQGVMVLDPDGRLYDAMIAIAERRLNKDGLAELFRTLAAASKGSDPPPRESGWPPGRRRVRSALDDRSPGSW